MFVWIGKSWKWITSRKDVSSKVHLFYNKDLRHLFQEKRFMNLPTHERFAISENTKQGNFLFNKATGPEKNMV